MIWDVIAEIKIELEFVRRGDCVPLHSEDYTVLSAALDSQNDVIVLDLKGRIAAKLEVFEVVAHIIGHPCEVSHLRIVAYRGSPLSMLRDRGIARTRVSCLIIGLFLESFLVDNLYDLVAERFNRVENDDLTLNDLLWLVSLRLMFVTWLLVAQGFSPDVHKSLIFPYDCSHVFQ